MSRLSSYLLLFVFLIAARLSVLAEDQVIGYAPEEPLFINQQYPTGLKEEDLKDLLLDDPKLRIAYAFLIRAAMGGPKIVDDRTPEMVVALNDLKRRGDSATPLLLDIMAKKHNTLYEDLIPHTISRIGTIKMEPYLEYLRQMVKTRPDEISAAANEVTSQLFLEHGTPEDAKMMQELAKKRPFLAPSLERAYEFQRWKHPDRSKSAETKTINAIAATLPLPKPPTPEKAAEAKPSIVSEEPTSSTPGNLIMVLVVAASGLLWLLLKRRS